MMRAIGRFSTRFPWLIMLVVVGITAGMIYQIKTNMYTEADLNKFLPKSMPTTKANDYYKKNFNYQDAMLIGVEVKDGTIMQPDVLRTIEKIVMAIEEMKVSKTFKSQLTGKEETLVLPVGIDTEDISSIANLEDAILDRETGAVVSGSVIAKLKKEYDIPYTEETEEQLPELNEDLEKIMLPLQNHVMGDITFRGNVLSEDLTASTIQVPMIRKWDYKRRYALLELGTAIDPEKLKARYQGKDTLFPFQVYGKTYGLTTYDDAFIQSHSEQVRSSLKDHLEDYLSATYDQHPQLETWLAGELTPQQFESIMKYVEERSFFMHPEMYTWENFTNNLYEFTLDTIDPLSLENLEFQLFNVKDIYDLNLIYEEALKIVNAHSNENIQFYVAGSPVVTAVFSHMIAKDMGFLLPLAVLVIFVILLLSFRSIKGVVIPLITVVISMIWALGAMAMTGTPVTAITSILPIVLLAVGSAYGIHFLNRYHEDAHHSKDRKQVLQLTVEHVGIAILMAGLTTIAGFSSLRSSELTLIQHFGIFSALGVCFALILSLTLSPALLSWWKLPKRTKALKRETIHQDGNLLDKLMHRWAIQVVRYPKTVITLFVVVTVAAGAAMPHLELEGGQMSNFKEGNPIKESDRFLNKHLTGTGLVNLLFKFRDEVNLESAWAKEELSQRVDEFVAAWKTFAQTQNELESSPIGGFVEKLSSMTINSLQSQMELKQMIAVISDMLNEEYTAAVENPVENTSQDEMAALDELETNLSEPLDNLEEMDGLGGLADTGGESEVSEFSGPFAGLTAEHIAGLKQLNQRLGEAEEHWERTGKLIVSIREQKSEKTGLQMQKSFNLLQDFFAVDIKQPYVLQKVESLYHFAKSMNSPQIELDGKDYNPTGFVVSPVDLVRKFYKVFYHDDNPDFDRLPNAEKDGLPDITLTDRGIIGVVLNQALSANRDTFESMVNPDLKEFQMSILTRDSSSSFIEEYETQIHQEITRVFPANDPYIEEVKIAGYAPTVIEVTNVISTSQAKSIALAFVFVFVVTFFIFRSVVGGFYSIVPLFFTVLANFGTMYVLGWQINTGTMLVASISIGIGVDYTIHFLERFKIQIRQGDNLEHAYFNTIHSSGKAILINAISVAVGFLVLMASDFVFNIAMGILMAGTMFYSSLGALSLLPALIFVMKPKFFQNNAVSSSKLKSLERKVMTKAA